MSETYSGAADVYEATTGRRLKSSVGYSLASADVNGEVTGGACGRCANYRPMMWRTSGACSKVEGPIGGRYWCQLFAPRPQP